jgi:hypothetical protein
LSPSIDRVSGRTGKRTEVDDSKLRDAIQTHGGKNWCAIAALVPGRTKLQCRTKWHAALLVSSIDPTTACAGKWTAVQDSKPKDAVPLHGGKGRAAITALIPGRTKSQCCSRCHDALGPDIDRATRRMGNWEEYEEIKLKDAVQTHGYKNWGQLPRWLRVERKGNVRLDGRNAWTLIVAESG